MSATPQPDPDGDRDAGAGQEAYAEVLALGAELGALLERLVRRHGGLSTTQFRALERLRGEHPEPMEPWELARSLTTGSAHVTAILDQLAGRGLVERAPHARDRRRRWVRLTAEGLALIDALGPEVAALEARVLGHSLAPGERTRLAELARRVRRGIAQLTVPTGRAGP